MPIYSTPTFGSGVWRCEYYVNARSLVCVQAPIYEAANKNHSGIVEYLISRGVPVDVRNYQNVSVGHAAARGGFVEVLTMLLDAGMPLDAVDDNLGTMLFYACASSRPGTARVLVERGVSVDQPVRNGMTPLIANTLGQGGSYEVIDLLTAHGANASAVEARGCAPLHFAASRGTPELVRSCAWCTAVCVVRSCACGALLCRVRIHGHQSALYRPTIGHMQPPEIIPATIGRSLPTSAPQLPHPLYCIVPP